MSAYDPCDFTVGVTAISSVRPGMGPVIELLAQRDEVSTPFLKIQRDPLRLLLADLLGDLMPRHAALNG